MQDDDPWKDADKPVQNPVKRLNSFRDMQDGWLDGDGYAPTDDNIDFVCNFFTNDYPTGLPYPCVCPTFEGNIEAEWFLQNETIDATIEFDFENKKLIWHYLNLSTNESDYQEFTMDAFHEERTEQLKDVFNKLQEWSRNERT